MQHAQSTTNNISVDLPSQTIKAGNHEFRFDLDSFRKRCLLEGLDDIGLTLTKKAAINSFETQRSQAFPWL
jgi:3-isopropylmalate dehydratase small subunit